MKDLADVLERAEEAINGAELYFVDDLCSVQTDLLKYRVQARKELLEAREKVRHPKDKEYTDLDRKTMLEAACADLEANYELAKGLEELIKERIETIRWLSTVE